MTYSTLSNTIRILPVKYNIEPSLIKSTFTAISIYQYIHVYKYVCVHKISFSFPVYLPYNRNLSYLPE